VRASLSIFRPTPENCSVSEPLFVAAALLRFRKKAGGNHRQRARASSAASLSNKLAVFDGRLAATGRAVINPTVPLDIPPDIWTSDATSVEVSTGDARRDLCEGEQGSR
jgi:hypothetical protein